MRFTGLSVFAITPANAAGVVVAEDFARIIERICSTGAASIGVLGSTGGFAYFDAAQRQRAIEIAVEASAGRVPIVAGIGALRTDAVLALARDAAAAGADALLLPPMAYTPLLEGEVFDLFSAAASASDLPLCIYNNPTTTRFVFSHALIERLAGLDTMAAIKMPAPAGGTIAEELVELRRSTAGRLAIGYSGDTKLAEALASGADCFFSALGGILPEEFVALSQAVQSNDPVARAAAEQRVAGLWPLLAKYGGLRLSYAFADRLGLTRTQPPLPISPISGAALSEIDAVLAQLA